MMPGRRQMQVLASLISVVLLVTTLAGPAAAQNNNNSGWRGEYYSNRSLRGNDSVVRQDADINFDWGEGSPAAGIGADNFSVRWTRSVHFDAGRYRFVTETDDGVRLFIDGRKVVDRWVEMSRTSLSVEVDLSAGSHEVRMEYFDGAGRAVARLSWSRLSQAPEPEVKPAAQGNAGNASPNSPAGSNGSNAPAPPNTMPYVPTSPVETGSVAQASPSGQGPNSNEQGSNVPPGMGNDPGSNAPGEGAAPTGSWFAQFYNNRYLEGSPRFTRNDDKIDFDWGTGSPDSRVGSDNFSVRWTRRVTFERGWYKFTVETDDGVRLYIGDTKLIDEWNNGSKKVSREIPLGDGPYTIKMEYYEATGNAKAKLWWEGPSGPLVGNLITWVPPYPSYSWVKVYRQDGGNWVDINPKGFASISASGYVKIDGLLVNRIYSGSGHPYWVELWIEGHLVRSIGNTSRGEPEFRIYPFRDNYTPW